MEKTELTVTICGENGYISRDNKIAPGFDRTVSYSCYGLSENPDDMIQQMVCVQRYFGMEEPLEMIHLIVDYGDLVKDDETASAYSESCAEYFCRNHQIYHCTHQDMQSLSYHVHLLINPISYLDGKILNPNIENMNRFCQYISESTSRSCQCIGNYNR